MVPGIDFIIAFLRTGFFRITENDIYRQRWLDKAEGFLEAVTPAIKPMAMVLEPAILPQEAELVFRLTQKFTAAGVPVYSTFKGAINALRHYAKYLAILSARGANQSDERRISNTQV